MTVGQGILLVTGLLFLGLSLQRIWKHAYDPRCPVCFSRKIEVKHIRVPVGEVEFYLCKSCPHTWMSR